MKPGIFAFCALMLVHHGVAKDSYLYLLNNMCQGDIDYGLASVSDYKTELVFFLGTKAATGRVSCNLHGTENIIISMEDIGTRSNTNIPLTLDECLKREERIAVYSFPSGKSRILPFDEASNATYCYSGEYSIVCKREDGRSYCHLPQANGSFLEPMYVSVPGEKTIIDINLHTSYDSFVKFSIIGYSEEPIGDEPEASINCKYDDTNWNSNSTGVYIKKKYVCDAVPHCPATFRSRNSSNPFKDEPSDCKYFFWYRRDPGIIIAFTLVLLAVSLIGFTIVDTRYMPTRTPKIVLITRITIFSTGAIIFGISTYFAFAVYSSNVLKDFLVALSISSGILMTTLLCCYGSNRNDTMAVTVARAGARRIPPLNSRMQSSSTIRSEEFQEPVPSYDEATTSPPAAPPDYENPGFQDADYTLPSYEQALKITEEDEEDEQPEAKAHKSRSSSLKSSKTGSSQSSSSSPDRLSMKSLETGQRASSE